MTRASLFTTMMSESFRVMSSFGASPNLLSLRNSATRWDKSKLTPALRKTLWGRTESGSRSNVAASHAIKPLPGRRRRLPWSVRCLPLPAMRGREDSLEAVLRAERVRLARQRPEPPRLSMVPQALEVGLVDDAFRDRSIGWESQTGGRSGLRSRPNTPPTGLQFIHRASRIGSRRRAGKSCSPAPACRPSQRW